MRRIPNLAGILIKSLRVAVVAVALVLIAIIGYVIVTAASPPPGAEPVIAGVDEAPLPNLIRGEVGHASSDGLSIWYESIAPEPPAKGVVLLIIGISNDAFGWPKSLIDALLAEGYQVVRFDNRGTGLSDWNTGGDERPPYSLRDMAADGVAVLDALGIEKAHLVGASMGGMIAQDFAIAFPDRTASLTAIMSSGHVEDPELPRMSRWTTKALVLTKLRYGLIGGETNIARMHLANRMILKGDADYELDAQETTERVLYNLRNRRGYNMRSTMEHRTAVRQSGSRNEQLAELRVPTLVIHGREDPLVPIAHGIRLAETIPGARGFWPANMGHDFPEYLSETLAREMTSFFAQEHGERSLTGLVDGAPR